MRKFKVFFALILVFLFPVTASALSPEDALSFRSDDSFYAVIRVDSLNGLLKAVFSPENMEMVMSVLSQEEAQSIRMIAAFASQVPANSMAISFGIADMSNMSGDKQPFFIQAAVSMPPSARAKLDKLADGSASAIDVATLILGDAGIVFAPAFDPEEHKGEKGTYYTLDGQVAIAAKDDLMLIALTPAELDASISALEDNEKRLALRRRFESPDYLKIHMDMPSIMRLAQKTLEGKEEVGNPDEFAKIFRAPFDMEIDFSSKPERFLVSFAANAIEAIEPEFYSGVKPSVGAGMFLAGGGKLLAGVSAPLTINISQMKAIEPEFAQIWERAGKWLEETGISASDAEDLINGTISFVFGSSATIMEKRVPGGYIALTGRNGAAAKILDKLMESKNFSGRIPFIPLKTDGWDSAFAVANPKLFPVPLLIGAVKDTLFMGVVDSGDLGKTPEISGEVAKMLEEPLFAVGAVEAAGIWNWVRDELTDPNSLLSIGTTGAPELVREIIKSVMEAELSIPLVKIWTPGLETSFLEFKIADVPEEKRLLKRVMDIVRIFIPQQDGNLDDDEDEPDEYGEEYDEETDETEEQIDENEEDRED